MPGLRAPGAAVPLGLPALPVTSGPVLMGLDVIFWGEEGVLCCLPPTGLVGPWAGAGKPQNDPIQQNSKRTQSFPCTYLVLFRIWSEKNELKKRPGFLLLGFFHLYSAMTFMQLIKWYPAKYTCRPTPCSFGLSVLFCFFSPLHFGLEVSSGWKGNWKPWFRGLTEVTSVLFINDKLELWQRSKVQNRCYFMHLLIGIGKFINLLSTGEMHLYFPCRESLFHSHFCCVFCTECFTCYVSSRGNAGSHKLFCGLPYIFFPSEIPIFGLVLLHELELVSFLEKESGTFLIVICNKKKKFKIFAISY